MFDDIKSTIIPIERRRKTILFTALWFIIILIISIVLGYLFSSIFLFNQETLFWMTSSIVSAFGALIAIMVAISIFQVGTINKDYNDMKDGLIGELLKLIAKEKTLTENDKKPIVDILKAELQQIEDLHKRMFCIILPMVILVGISLLILFFTKTTFKISPHLDGNILLSIGLTFLVLYSLFSLFLLSYELHAFLDWKRRLM